MTMRITSFFMGVKHTPTPGVAIPQPGGPWGTPGGVAA